MASAARLRTGSFRVLMMLALVALALRAAIPTGFMLAASQDRWITMTICTGSTPMQMSLNVETGEQREGVVRSGGAPTDEEQDRAARQAPCVFAAVAAPAPPSIVEIAAPQKLLVADARPNFSDAVAIGRGLAAPPPWSTGPPTHL